MVESVDDLKCSCSVRGIRMPDFGVLDAKIASALNRIIHNTRFKKRVTLEEKKAPKEGRFLRGRQIAYLIYEYFRRANDSVENYADLFTVVLRNDDIQEFDSKWDESLLSMTQIPSDDILESLYTLRIRESEKLKTVLELYDLETHQKKLGPDYHRLKTMVKRSIEQNLRMKNFEARNGNYETNAVVKNQGTKQREQRTLGDCWQWKANGQGSKGENCSFRHDINKRAKSTQPNPSPGSSTQQNAKKCIENQESWRQKPKWENGSTAVQGLPLRNLHQLHSVKSGILRSACSTSRKMDADFGKSALMHTARLTNSPAKGLKRMVAKRCSGYVENYTTIGSRVSRYGAAEVFIDFAEELKHTETNRFTEAVVRHANIRDQNPSLGMICPSDPHQRNPQCSKI